MIPFLGFITKLVPSSSQGYQGLKLLWSDIARHDIKKKMQNLSWKFLFLKEQKAKQGADTLLYVRLDFGRVAGGAGMQPWGHH